MFVKSRNTDEFPKSFHLYHHKKKTLHVNILTDDVIIQNDVPESFFFAHFALHSALRFGLHKEWWSVTFSTFLLLLEYENRIGKFCLLWLTENNK